MLGTMCDIGTDRESSIVEYRTTNLRIWNCKKMEVSDHRIIPDIVR